MLYKLSLDANTIAISYWPIQEYTTVFSFGEQILLDFDTHEVGLSKSICQSMTSVSLPFPWCLIRSICGKSNKIHLYAFIDVKIQETMQYKHILLHISRADKREPLKETDTEVKDLCNL